VDVTTPESAADELELLDALLLERFGRRRRRRSLVATDLADTRECPFSLPRITKGLPGVPDRKR